MRTLAQRLTAIEKRNQRVEADKAWETSLERVILVAVLTYGSMCLLMWSLKIDQPWLNAIVPTAGFLLSTQSLSWFKQIWLKHRNKK